MNPYYQAILDAPNPTTDEWDSMTLNQQIMRNIKLCQAKLIYGVEQRRKEHARMTLEMLA
jgi:hypothetical protein